MFQRLFNLLDDECHDLDQRTTTTVSTQVTSYEKYIEAKISLNELQQEKESLTEQIKVIQQHMVLHLLTSPDHLQNLIVQSAVQFINNGNKKITEIASTCNSTKLEDFK